MLCPHGFDGDSGTLADADERSACCGVFVTFTGDGDLVCRCCYALVTGGDPVEGITFTL